MAKGKTDVDRRPNTLKENKLVLCELRTRKIEHKSSHELNKLFAKFNSRNSLKYDKYGKASLRAKEEKIAEHPYGPINGFPSGSWWGIRMDCSRDRVHDPFNEPIQEGPHGVVSLCTSHLNNNNDIDLGDLLTFTGNEYESGVTHVDPLVQNYQNQLPLRLIRSYNLTNEFAPKTGYRYDGLYSVAGYWIGSTSDMEKHYKFALVRLPNQEPPTWATSVRKSSNFVLRAKSSKAQAGCSAQKISTNICNNSIDGAHNQDASSNIISQARTARLSQKQSIVPNNGSIVDKLPTDSKRNTHESAIVTRCISKKTECPPVMVSVPYAESYATSCNRILDNSPKSTVCKLQNTNISIRTDLYDSSNSLHQETRKITPMTFCRTYNKTSRGQASRIVNHPSVVTLNLNSCGPCPRDNAQESLIQSRSGVGKLPCGQSPSSDSNRSIDRLTPKSSATMHLESRTIPDENTTNNPLINGVMCESGQSMEPTEFINKEISNRGTLEKKLHGRENSLEKTIQVPKSSKEMVERKIEDNETGSSIVGKNAKVIVESPASNTKEKNEEKISKELDANLDSLTPDQMLNFIVKQKYHPAAKLLIGRVIGLATGESMILRTRNSLENQKIPCNSEKTVRSKQSEMNLVDKRLENVPKIDPPNRDEDSTNKERKKGPMVWKTVTKRILKESQDRRLMKMRLARTRVSKRTDKKANIKASRPRSSQRLKRSNLTEIKSQQAFSKPTIPKKNQKRAKKRRRELANLVIDANIGPKMRGPRNRRLRCTTHFFAKKRHGNQKIAHCEDQGSPEIEARGKKENVRVQLSSRRKSKRLISAEKSRISQSRYTSTKKRSQETKRSIVERDYRREQADVKVRTKSIDATQQTRSEDRSTRGAKRKISPTGNYGREQESIETRKRSCGDTRKNGDRTSVIKMIDAETQCSSRENPINRTNSDVDITDRSSKRSNFVKIECIDLEEIKTEIYESDEYEDSTRSKNDDTEIFQREIEDATRSRAFVPTNAQTIVGQRSSAFVPVNITDADSRIARLRSIGFKPIEPVCLSRDAQLTSDDDQNFPNTSNVDFCESTAVLSREVDELFNKYTSEETTVVGYMDQELRYQDIEDEVIAAVRKSRNAQAAAKTGRKVSGLENARNVNEKRERVGTTRGQRAVRRSNEEDPEVPWHGWKKFVKNKKAHWIGW